MKISLDVLFQRCLAHSPRFGQCTSCTLLSLMRNYGLRARTCLAYRISHFSPCTRNMLALPCPTSASTFRAIPLETTLHIGNVHLRPYLLRITSSIMTLNFFGNAFAPRSSTCQVGWRRLYKTPSSALFLNIRTLGKEATSIRKCVKDLPPLHTVRGSTSLWQSQNLTQKAYSPGLPIKVNDICTDLMGAMSNEQSVTTLDISTVSDVL